MKTKNNILQHLSIIALAFTGLAANSAQAATATWTGATNTWNTAGNWTGTNVPPISGDSLIFSAAGAGGTTLNNDLTSAAFNVAGITFNATASAYTIGGNDFTLTGNITNSSTTNAQIINNAMDFTAQRTITTTNAAAGITLGGLLSGTGGSLLIASTGAGTVTISNANNSFNGGVTIGSGTASGNTAILRATASGALGSGTVTIIGNSSASRLELTSGITLSNAIILAGVASTTTSGIQNISGSNILSGTIDLQAGGVEHQIQSDAGLLTLGTAGATAITTTVTSNRNVTLQGAGDGAVVGNIINNISNGAGTVTVKKAGTGTWTLSGTNTYTGATTVNAGKLVVNGNSSTIGLTTVNNNATVGGFGTIGALTVSSGGMITPGDGVGILSAGNTNLQASSTLSMDINGNTLGTGYDQLNITGTVSLAGELSVSLGGYTPVNSDLFFILANDGADAITGTFSNASIEGGTYTFDGQDFQISYSGNYVSPGVGTFTGGNDVVLMAVPEPQAALLGALGILALLRRRRI